MKSDQFALHADIEDRHWWFLGRRKIMRDLIRRVVPPSKSVTVVDVGCGTGGNIAALAQDYTCIGVDTSQKAIQFVRSRFPNVHFIHGSVPTDLADIMEQTRLFLLMDVLEHVPDDFAFLSELLGASNPGAYIFLTVPADMSLWSEHDISFGHYRRYDIQRLRRVWSDPSPFIL